MEPKHTAASIAAIIRGRIESDLPDVVLAALRKIDGKPIATRLLDQLPGGRIEWTLKREFGRTFVVNNAYIGNRFRQQDGDGACRIELAESEASVALDCAWVERANSSLYAGRRDRNARREAALGDANLCGRLAICMNEIEAIRAQLAFVTKQFHTFTDDEGPFHPDRYQLEAACGMRER